MIIPKEIFFNIFSKSLLTFFLTVLEGSVEIYGFDIKNQNLRRLEILKFTFHSRLDVKLMEQGSARMHIGTVRIPTSG